MHLLSQRWTCDALHAAHPRPPEGHNSFHGGQRRGTSPSAQHVGHLQSVLPVACMSYASGLVCVQGFWQ